MDLFDLTNNTEKSAPLAERMRPQSLDKFIGQKHLLHSGSLLLRAIQVDKLGSCIFFGPPGTGKTTLAGIIANSTKSEFVKLNAVSSGVSDAKKVIEDATERLRMYGKRTFLLLDECHRWNKAQSDCVLSAIETGSIIFIGSTTENPFISMTRAIVSRCRVFELKSLTDDEIVDGLKRAAVDPKGLGEYKLEIKDEAYRHIAWSSNGDLRNAYNALELAVLTTPPSDNGVIVIDEQVAQQSTQHRLLSIDDSMYYDMLSAFCKSLRGCDPDAALYWAFRLIEAGCDPLLLFRRMLAHASEDVGMADTSALITVTSALTAYEHIGVPEGYLSLAHAIIKVTTAPKSNSVYLAKAAAQRAVKSHADDVVPDYLRDRTYKTPNDSGAAYIYPHDSPEYITQQYLPKSLQGEVFYKPQDNPNERKIEAFLDALRKNRKQ
ncbi:MAG: replication-associated recombination protein A [Clostridiales bacterium]|nr:replication-associated recombination protein A [Clostridiales bacterium]